MSQTNVQKYLYQTEYIANMSLLLGNCHRLHIASLYTKLYRQNSWLCMLIKMDKKCIYTNTLRLYCFRNHPRYLTVLLHENIHGYKKSSTSIDSVIELARRSIVTEIYHQLCSRHC